MSTTIDRRLDTTEVFGDRRSTKQVGNVPNSQLYRASGLAVMVGAAAYVIYILARSVLTAGMDPATAAKDSLWVPINAIGFLGAALVLLGLPALYLGIARRSGVLGLVGLVLISVSWMFFGVFLSLYGALVEPWLADKAPSLLAASAPIPIGFIVAFVTGLLAWQAGSVLFGLPFIRGRVPPRWVGYVLVLSGLWAIAGDLIAPSGPSSNLAINLVSNLGPVLLVIALEDLGFRLWTQTDTARV